MKTRNLKIESAGDFWRGKVSPKIRLTGQWLERAGFKPGNRVKIIMSEPGTLTLKFLPEHDNNSIQTQSATL
jgi:Toxin SymE, type I toxin-antitoxin system